MSDPSRFDEAFDGYQTLANQLLASWTPFAAGVSAKVVTGAYGFNEAAADLSKAARLMTDSLMAIGSEAIGAVAVLTSDFSEETTVGYGTDPDRAGTTRSLALAGDLASASGQVLPRERVAVRPDTLLPGQSTFVLEVDGEGLKARTYDGYVVATDDSGDVEEIFVSVTIG